MTEDKKIEELTNKLIKNLAMKLSESGYNEPEVYEAYIENMGLQYVDEDSADEIDEAYAGEYASDEEFAQDMAEQTGAIDKDVKWPYTCIDWEWASRELMYDYYEVNGFYFRNV